MAPKIALAPPFLVAKSSPVTIPSGTASLNATRTAVGHAGSKQSAMRYQVVLAIGMRTGTSAR